MHRYRKTKKYARQNAKHAAKQHRRELAWREHRRARNRFVNRLKAPDRTEWARIRKDTGTNSLILNAPSKMSFVNNPLEMVQFINALERCFKNNRAVYVQLSHVSEIDYDAITVLLSVMVRFKALSIRFNGSKPLDLDARLKLEQSGFFDHLFKGRFRDEDRYSIEGPGAIFTHAFRKVDPELSGTVVDEISKAIWGDKRRCAGVYRALIELMQNTTNHASLSQEAEKHWWLSTYHDKSANRVSLTFVDYGVGVFQSLNSKRSSDKWYKPWALVRKLFPVGQHDQLKAILNGDLHRTITGEPWRGKGLPGIYDACKTNHFTNFTMVTNGVYFNSNTDECRKLNAQFSGTFVYWEIEYGSQSIESAA